MPEWREPREPDVSVLREGIADSAGRLFRRLLVTFVLFVVLKYASADELAAFVLVGAVVAFVVVPIVLPLVRLGFILSRARAARQTHYNRLLKAQQDWENRRKAHERAEWARLEAAQLWHPLRLRSGPSRVDVFGGTAESWSNLLATLGCSLAQAGTKLTVADFSEQYVTSALAGLMFDRGHRITQIELPTHVDRYDLLAGLAPDEAAELLAQAVHTLREQGDHVDLRALDADLLETVLSRLTGVPTFSRVVAGLEVVRRNYDSVTDRTLDAEELTLLSSAVDNFGQGERVQQELQFLISSLRKMIQGNDSGNGKASLSEMWDLGGLTVVNTTHDESRRKDFLDRVVFHRLLHDVRGLRDGGDRVLFVVGADAMGLKALEMLAKQCRRVGLRLILMMERLRGDLKELLGSSDSAAILMRLGNAQDAAAAAEFIGKGYKFVLSQTTTQASTTLTKGTANTTSASVGESNTDTRSKTRGTSWNQDAAHFFISSRGGSGSTTTGTSFTESLSSGWSESVNQSTGDTITKGDAESRVHEYVVEPTTLQSLALMAFVLVESLPSERRVVIGDCNPGITSLDRVAQFPRS